jgi:hypothetical protein
MQVIDGHLTSAEMTNSRFDARNMNQRVQVRVCDSAAFRDACGLRCLEGDNGIEAGVRLDDVRAAAGATDAHAVQWRVTVLRCAGAAAVSEVAGLNAEQLQMWLLEHACRPCHVPWQAAARMILYLCVSHDGLPLPLLLDIILLDHAIDMQDRNSSINPSFVSLCRTAVPFMIHACAHVRIVRASQRSRAYDGLMWRVASPRKLLPLLEAAAGLKADRARTNLLEYFEGGMRRYMARLNHIFHDQSSAHQPASADPINLSQNTTRINSATPVAALTPAVSIRIPPPPPFNLHRMIEGTHLALTLGVPAAVNTACNDTNPHPRVAGDTVRAIAFVVPHIRGAFAAGMGGRAKAVLEAIARGVGGTAGCSTGDEALMQWSVFVNANFGVISKEIGIFDAVAQQWDVHGVVYESVCGRKYEADSEGGCELSLSNAAAAVIAESQLSGGIGSAAAAYFHNPLRHTFPTVSYHQRTRFSYLRGSSRLSVVRCATTRSLHNAYCSSF